MTSAFSWQNSISLCPASFCTPRPNLPFAPDVSQRRPWHPTPVLLPGKSHGRRSLVGCSPWGQEESDMTEIFHFHFSLSCTGEGNGTPLQCSGLENPRDGGAWWAVVYGVAQNRTQLKRFSSSSSSSSIQLDNKTPNIQFRNGNRIWTNTFPKNTYNGQQVLEKALNLPDHQRNAKRKNGWLRKPFRTNTQKRCSFHYRGLECKSRKSRNTWLLLLSCFSHVQLCATA